MSKLRHYRQGAGLTQSELAARAGVSRQLVGAVEAGRHQPRVDAALAVAAVLGVDAATLFGPVSLPVDIVTGEPPEEGAMVRTALVDGRAVTAPVRSGSTGWGVADGQIVDGVVSEFSSRRDGLVVAGCEPGLEVVELMLRERGVGAVAASASSKAAIEALAAGRAHAAVVHGPALRDLPAAMEINRFALTSWRVGLAAPPDVNADWWREALTGAIPVVQREPGAGVQATFEDHVDPGTRIAGPRVGGHIEAALRAVAAGIAAVTIEPAALAADAQFHPLATHQVELWVGERFARSRLVEDAFDVIASRRFRERLVAVGGYDLSGSGSRVA